MELSTPHPTRRPRNTNFNQAFERMKDKPSTQEEIVIELLKKVDTKTWYGGAIAEILAKNKMAMTRQLISELLSQCNDSPDNLKIALGQECYDELMKLKL